MVTLTSNIDPSHDSHIPPRPDTAVKAHCKPLLKQHWPPLWPVSPHLSTESQQRNCCHTHLQSSSAQCKPNQGQTELSAQGPEHSSQRSFPVTPNFAHLLSHSTWILKQGTDPGRQYWMFQKPAGSLPMPLLILTVFGFAKHYLCRTTAWYCLVNQAQSTDQLWPFMSCTTEGLRTWRDHQPHKSLSYQQQSLYSLPRESWGKCALQQKQYARGAAEPTT